MAIKTLSKEQIETMTLREKDEWWLKNVYRGNMPQLNIRSALCGMILGGLLSLTNLYVGIRTGWVIGAGVTSVVMAFAIFKVFKMLHIGEEMSILENNAMQSIATAASYMTSLLISSIPAYMMVTGNIVPMWHTLIWIILLSLFGALVAFPLKKRYINDEQLPFPEGAAAGVVMDNLHSDDGPEGMFKAKVLFGGGLVAAIFEFLGSGDVLAKLHMTAIAIPKYWDELLYKAGTIPTIRGIPLKDLTVRFDSSLIFVGLGGLVGIKTGLSIFLGSCINYLYLAPMMMERGIITGPGFRNITQWALWGGAAMMTTASIYSFASKPKVILASFTSLFSKKSKGQEDILKDIELPMKVFAIGIPIMSVIIVVVGHHFFELHWLMGVIAILLVSVFTLIAVVSTGLTSITPSGALAKLTQLTFSALEPGNVKVNIATAGITSEVASNASMLLNDIKPGYMLGAKPRHQAVGHVLGIIAGAVCATPVFYMLFANNIDRFGTEQFPLPAAVVWKAVADTLSKGFSVLHPTAQLAILVGGILGLVFEIANQATKGKFPISAMGVGLAFILPFPEALAMGLGSTFFWLMAKKYKDKKSLAHRIFVENDVTLCSGVMAGGAIIGLILILIENFA